MQVQHTVFLDRCEQFVEILTIKNQSKEQFVEVLNHKNQFKRLICRLTYHPCVHNIMWGPNTYHKLVGIFQVTTMLYNGSSY